MNQYFIYIMTNKSRTLYTGVTNNLERRVRQHQRKAIPGFTSKYNITRLVYYETFREVLQALAREKQIKGWLRARKVTLIESTNPEWRDLSLPSGHADPSLRAPAGRSAQDDTGRGGLTGLRSAQGDTGRGGLTGLRSAQGDTGRGGLAGLRSAQGDTIATGLAP